MNLSLEAHRLTYSILFLMCFYITAEEHIPCPVGFDLSYDGRHNEYICYKLKRPEPFNDKYIDCEENIYSLELHFRLNISRLDAVTIWIDYASLYPGGPYMDLADIEKETSITQISNNRGDCLVVYKDILTAVKCDEIHSRYCFEKSLSLNNGSNSEREFQPFDDKPNKCLLPSNVTWNEAKSLCEDDSWQINRALYRNIRSVENEGKLLRYAANRNVEAEELVEQLLHYLYLLLESDVISDIDQVFDQLDYLLGLDKDVAFPAELSQLLQALGPRVDLSWYLTSVTVRNNAALLISTPQGGARGIYMARTDDNIFTEHTFSFVTDIAGTSRFDVGVYDAVLTVPEDIWHFFQISFMVFRDDRIFYQDQSFYVINSRILSLNVSHFADIENEVQIAINLRPFSLISVTSTLRHACVRWVVLLNGSGYWSEDGCELILPSDPDLLFTCQCKLFFTYYALTLSPSGDPATTGEDTTLTTPGGEPPTPITTSTKTTTTSTETNSTTETIILAPEEQIQQVLDHLDQLLNQTTPILVDDISQVFDEVDDLLNLEPGLDFPSQMLQLLDELGANVELSGNLTSAVVRSNIGLLMADVTEDNPVRGLFLASRDTDAFTSDAFGFLIGDLDPSLLNANVSEAVVALPVSLTRYPRRISFLVYHSDRAFNFDREQYAVNSRVLGISVGNYTELERGEVVEIHLRPDISQTNRDERRVCAYWQFLDETTGYWSQEGCRLIRSRDPWTLDICRCDHLTHFAEVLAPRPVFSQLHEDILEILSIIGCLLSIFGLVIIILTAVLFRSWRKNFRNQIWLQLCIALFLMSLCFLIVVFQKHDEYSLSCLITGISLHYSVLASFCWMLVVAVKSYSDLVLVFIKQIRRKGLIASGFSWGVPAVIIFILLLVDAGSYLRHFEETNPSSNFCYPSGVALWVALYAPILIMLLANWIFFFLIIWKIGFASKSPRSHKAGENQEAWACIRLSFVLVFLFGLPWVFGVFSYNVVAAYFFTCTVTIQGFVLFILIVCGNTQTKNLWLGKLKRKKHKSFTVTSKY